MKWNIENDMETLVTWRIFSVMSAGASLLTRDVLQRVLVGAVERPYRGVSNSCPFLRTLILYMLRLDKRHAPKPY